MAQHNWSLKALIFILTLIAILALTLYTEVLSFQDFF